MALIQSAIRKRPSKSGIASLLVSLYLVVLSFFILLNTLSDVNEQKEKQVLEMLSETFTVKVRKGTIGRLPVSSNVPAPSVKTTEYLGAIKELIASYFPLMEVQEVKKGQALKVQFKMKDFFFIEEDKEAGTKVLKVSEEYEHLIENISGVTKSHSSDDVSIRINLITEVGEAGLGFSALERTEKLEQSRQLALEKTQALIALMSKYHFTNQQFAISIINHPNNMIEFIFVSNKNGSIIDE